MISAVVRSVTESELAFIASADYGQDVQEHLAALRGLIFEQDGILRDGQTWFPYEVVELGSHSLKPGHEREFVICTLLVLANVAAGVDKSTDIAAKFADRAAEYDQLSPQLREEILNAYTLAEG
jgi:hypothetical protein